MYMHSPMAGPDLGLEKPTLECSTRVSQQPPWRRYCALMLGTEHQLRMITRNCALCGESGRHIHLPRKAYWLKEGTLPFFQFSDIV